eukprot:s152_g23.t3
MHLDAYEAAAGGGPSHEMSKPCEDTLSRRHQAPVAGSTAVPGSVKGVDSGGGLPLEPLGQEPRFGSISGKPSIAAGAKEAPQGAAPQRSPASRPKAPLGPPLLNTGRAFASRPGMMRWSKASNGDRRRVAGAWRQARAWIGSTSAMNSTQPCRSPLVRSTWMTASVPSLPPDEAFVCWI